MKKLKRFIIYLRLWFIRKMGYTLPSLREATSVVPGEFYDLFGRIVRAVPNRNQPHHWQKATLSMRKSQSIALTAICSKSTFLAPSIIVCPTAAIFATIIISKSSASTEVTSKA